MSKNPLVRRDFIIMKVRSYGGELGYVAHISLLSLE
jgi:hypothetical protein